MQSIEAALDTTQTNPTSIVAESELTRLRVEQIWRAMKILQDVSLTVSRQETVTVHDPFDMSINMSVDRGELSIFLRRIVEHINTLPSLYVLREVAKTIHERYSQIDEVEAIYEEIDDTQHTFWIFTSNRRYDDELMDRLIFQEEEIFDIYPKHNMSINYVASVMAENHREVVGNNAAIIFER